MTEAETQRVTQCAMFLSLLLLLLNLQDVVPAEAEEDGELQWWRQNRPGECSFLSFCSVVCVVVHSDASSSIWTAKACCAHSASVAQTFATRSDPWGIDCRGWLETIEKKCWCAGRSRFGLKVPLHPFSFEMTTFLLIVRRFCPDSYTTVKTTRIQPTQKRTLTPNRHWENDASQMCRAPLINAQHSISLHTRQKCEETGARRAWSHVVVGKVSCFFLRLYFLFATRILSTFYQREVDILFTRVQNLSNQAGAKTFILCPFPTGDVGVKIFWRRHQNFDVSIKKNPRREPIYEAISNQSENCHDHQRSQLACLHWEGEWNQLSRINHP